MAVKLLMFVFFYTGIFAIKIAVGNALEETSQEKGDDLIGCFEKLCAQCVRHEKCVPCVLETYSRYN